MQYSKYKNRRPAAAPGDFLLPGAGSSASRRARFKGGINLGAEHENLDQKAYQILKAMIMERNLLPGEKIPQEKLAEDLGISRTPLVNALKFLEQEKLVQSMPRRGFFVRLFTRKEMIAIFELREVLEGLAARRAACNISDREASRLRGFFSRFAAGQDVGDIKAYAREDRQFHNFLTEVGSKEFLKSILETYNIISFSYQSALSEGLVRPPEETLQEHLAIIEAVAGRDADEAERLMRQHLFNSAVVLRRGLESE
jgi:DNA-binding GntR family transcriptional regulator